MTIPTPANLVPGFNKFEGLFNIRNAATLRLAELFGHEAAHAEKALNNVPEAVSLQRQLNDRDAEIRGRRDLPRRERFPYPPDLIQRMEAANRALIPTERYAQEREQIINRELNAGRRRRR